MIRYGASFQAAEDVLQGAVLAALERWPQEGLPRQPAAWLLRVAQRKLIDSWRREQRAEALDEALQA